MRLFFLLVFAAIGASQVTVPPIIYPRYLLAFYAAVQFPKLDKEWDKCYQTDRKNNGSIIMEQCSGTCVIKFQIRKDPAGKEKYLNTTTYWCQELDIYPPQNVHVCTDAEVRYPNVRIYYDSRQDIKTHLYCCHGNLCNAPGTYVPIEPAYYLQKEHPEMDHYEISLIVTCYIVVLVLMIMPFLYWRREKAEDEQLMTSLDDMPEKAVILMQYKPKMKHIQVKTPTTGQFSFHDLCRRFAEIDLYYRKTKINKPMKTNITIKHYLLDAGGHGHSLVKAKRDILVRYESLVWTILEHGPYAYEWKPIDLVELFDQAKELFEAEPALLHLALPLAFIGDIRGQYTDLMRWLSLVGLPPRRKLLFLGGVIDPNERGSLDCLALVSALKVAYPTDVFLLRGVPESMPIHFGSRYGIRDDETIQSAATRLCHHLPIAARVHKRILAVHSGISHQLSNPKCFDLVRRPFGLDDMPNLARQLIFNQPTTAIKMYRSDPSSRGDFFGFTAVNRLCREMNLKFIIRSRNPLSDGVMWNVRSKLMSIWSAPGKHTKEGEVQRGSVVLMDASGNMNIFSIAAQKEGSITTTEEKKKS